jgi:hypothetical protein
VSASPEDSKQLPQPGAEPNIAPAVIEGQLPTASVRVGVGVINDIGANNITSRAQHIRNSSDEAMVWQESPSLALLVPRAVKYAIWMAVIFLLCWGVNRFVATNPWVQPILSAHGVKPTVSAPMHSTRKTRSRRSAAVSEDAASTAASDADALVANQVKLSLILFAVKAVFAIFFLLRLLSYLMRLKTTKYCASSQRLIVEEGSWHTVNRPYELHQLGDAVIEKPLLLRLFDVSNLIIQKPFIPLYGLRNAEYVRDILRQGGQLEAQRADKIRWR